ncbi:MAG: hypothetical protein AVDCRST_MAG37-1085, partial [uncultured Rubrobacteraceae bacterium]
AEQPELRGGTGCGERPPEFRHGRGDEFYIGGRSL